MKRGPGTIRNHALRAVLTGLLLVTCGDTPGDDIAYQRLKLALAAEQTNVATFLDACFAELRATEGYGGKSPSAVASSARRSLGRLVEATADAATPEFRDELTRQLRDVVCDPDVVLEKVLLSVMLMKRLRAANSEGIECVVSARPPADTSTVAAALEAWRSSSLPMTSTLLQIKNSATDERIKMRFMSIAEMIEFKRQGHLQGRMR